MRTPTRVQVRRRPSPLLLLVACAMAVVAAASPAYAGPSANVKWVAYDGKSVSMAQVPAQPVILTALSSGPFTSATFAVAGRPGVVTSSDVTTANGQSRVSARVDLTGTSGKTAITVVYTAGKTTSTVRKVLVAVPPASATPSSAPAAGTTVTPATAASAPAEETVPAPQSTSTAPPAPSSDPMAGSGGAPNRATPAVSVADRTGVPSGVALTPQTGNITVTRDGTVIDGVDLAGCIVIRANDVTIRNSKIRCASSTTAMVIATSGSFRNLIVEDSELDGAGGVDIGVGWQNFTLRRVEITGVNDGVRAGSNSTIEDSWIHGMTRRGALHPDAIQSTGGTRIRVTGNVLDPRNLANGDLNNSAIMLGSETTPALADVVISGNQMGGGNYTVNVRGDTAVSNVTLSDNVFTGNARYGPIQAPASVVVGAGNVAADGSAARVVLTR